MTDSATNTGTMSMFTNQPPALPTRMDAFSQAMGAYVASKQPPPVSPNDLAHFAPAASGASSHTPVNSSSQQWVHTARVWLRTPTGVAFSTAMAALVLLWLINPPFVRRRAQNEMELQPRSLPRLAIWALVVFAVVRWGPLLFKGVGGGGSGSAATAR